MAFQNFKNGSRPSWIPKNRRHLVVRAKTPLVGFLFFVKPAVGWWDCRSVTFFLLIDLKSLVELVEIDEIPANDEQFQARY
jgi:hypothetical protein